ncbi:stalk domain-containing protein, partial [Anaerosporobacter sp.]
MKKITSFFIIVIVLTLLTSIPAYAGKSKAIKVVVNDKTIKCNLKPYVKDGEVMVPLRQIAQAVGATVKWNKKTKTDWVHLDMIHVEVPVGKKSFYIHRDADLTGIPQKVKLKNSTKIVNGRVVVPAKTFFESVGMTVKYDSKKRVLTITSANSLPDSVPYEEISSDTVKGNDTLMNWYNKNNMNAGISYIREGKYMYALIGAGEKPTGGYTIHIDNVVYTTKDTVSINARVTPPVDNAIMVITYPSLLIRIKSDTIKTVIGEIDGSKAPSKEEWVTMDSATVSKMELFNLEQVKIRDITGTDKENIMNSFNEATIDPNMYIEMITGNMLKVTMNEGYVLTFTSYGSKSNVIVKFEKDDDLRTFHIVAP